MDHLLLEFMKGMCSKNLRRSTAIGTAVENFIPQHFFLDIK